MRRGGHANPAAALRYQPATEDRDRAIAEALSELATASVTQFRRAAGDRVARETRETRAMRVETLYTHASSTQKMLAELLI